MEADLTAPRVVRPRRESPVRSTRKEDLAPPPMERAKRGWSMSFSGSKATAHRLRKRCGLHSCPDSLTASFGWARVDRHFATGGPLPRIFVEFVGQGDSDKPADYPYGTMERADLVEALWEAEGIQSTFVVTFDYSSLVALELLSRQEERLAQGTDSGTKIEGVLMANGGYFADAHSHPLMTTPALRSPIGGMVTWFGQRSRFIARQLLKSMFSKEYRLTFRGVQRDLRRYQHTKRFLLRKQSSRVRCGAPCQVQKAVGSTSPVPRVERISVVPSCGVARATSLNQTR